MKKISLKSSRIFRSKYWLFFIGGLFLGLLVLFPFSLLKNQWLASLQQEQGFSLELGDLSLYTGLGLGWGRGGVLGIKASKTSFSPSPQWSIQCDEAILSPHLLSLFILQLKVSVACRKNNGASELLAVLKKKLWRSNEGLSADIYLKKIFLKDWIPNTEGIDSNTAVSGNISMAQLQSLDIFGIKNIDGNLEFNSFSTPPVQSDFLHLPSIAVGNLKIIGRKNLSRFELSELSFGSPKNPMEAKLQGFVELDPSFNPVQGELSGDLRVDPEFEKTVLGDMNLTLFFGNIKPSGSRSFKKSFKGNWLSFLLSPALDR